MLDLLLRLYTLESNLYRLVNKDLGAHNMLSQLLPYVSALRASLFSSALPVFSGVCYRSVTLDESDIECYRQLPERIAWNAFSSCTRNVEIARNWHGNVLMIVDCGLHDASTPTIRNKVQPRNISECSLFPHEEEVLLINGSNLRVDECMRPNIRRRISSHAKWQIYLTLLPPADDEKVVGLILGMFWNHQTMYSNMFASNNLSCS